MNGQYGTGWLACVLCGLTSPDVAPRKPGDPPVCPNVNRCNAVRNGENLGGDVWDRYDIEEKFDPDALPEPPPPDFKGEKPPPPTLLELLDESARRHARAESEALADVVERLCADGPSRTANEVRERQAEMMGGFFGPDGSFSV